MRSRTRRSCWLPRAVRAGCGDRMGSRLKRKASIDRVEHLTDILVHVAPIVGAWHFSEPAHCAAISHAAVTALSELGVLGPGSLGGSFTLAVALSLPCERTDEYWLWLQGRVRASARQLRSARRLALAQLKAPTATAATNRRRCMHARRAAQVLSRDGCSWTGKSIAVAMHC
jgi:hypothetical protein